MELASYLYPAGGSFMELISYPYPVRRFLYGTGKLSELALTLKEFLDSFIEDENKEDSTSKVIEDGKYLILENHVSILKAFTMVVDITTSLLLTWFHLLALAQYVDFEIKFFIARLMKLVHAYFGLQTDHDVPVHLNLAGLDVQIAEQIAEQLAVVDSKEIVIIEQC
ncbi:hypothetical protein TEA_005574 [Camellia sinensis var. sinensis]|uniref:Uncharacterized protein n=1 Tax=Camellia sinensis var. sinensis TaxID=542762 RepID=A0A4S4ETJ2_CAMSN|nr:hypothetical protein TEA_005574 [Camellia sinensis var. sinensis]